MVPAIYPDFLASYIGHVVEQTVLGHQIVAGRVLTSIDPDPGTVIVHGRNLQKRDANGMRNQRVRITIYGHGFDQTQDIADVLHDAITDQHGLTIPPNNLNPDQTFFDHIDSEQAPTQMESPGLQSICFNFDLVAVSRPTN